MKQLNLPAYSFRIEGKEGSEKIFDSLRRKWVRLTPEEWVRQNFVRYLVNEGGYPPGLIGIEVNFKLGTMRKRVDILVHDRNGNPVMIVECKSPEVRISDFYEDKVYDQVGEYNSGYRVLYAVVTNGMLHYAFMFNSAKNIYEHMLEIPLYEELTKKL